MCGVQAGSAAAACGDAGTAPGSQPGPGALSWSQGCSASVGDTSAAVGCESRRGFGAGGSYSDDTCTAGPVSVDEHRSEHTGDDTDELTVRAGDASVACVDDDAEDTYELDECAAR
jgi:hypothetical protein